MTVVPEIVDVDYVYLIMSADILYDTKKTTLTAAQINTMVKQGIITFAAANLNTFNSTFVASDLTEYIKGLNNSIIAADIDVYLQKRLIPELNNPSNYTINFGNAIEQGLGKKRVIITPSFSQYDSAGTLISDVFFEESSDPILAGTLQTYYYQNNIKNILANSTATSNAGTIDYMNGVVKLKNFVPNTINSNDGLLRINASADSRIISSTYNRIITLDELDPLAITVNVRIK